MLIAFLRDDLQYNFYMDITKVESAEDIKELLEDFKELVRKQEDIYYSPEYFKEFLEAHNFKAKELSSMEVGQIYWGD